MHLGRRSSCKTADKCAVSVGALPLELSNPEGRERYSAIDEGSIREGHRRSRRRPGDLMEERRGNFDHGLLTHLVKLVQISRRPDGKANIPLTAQRDGSRCVVG